MLVVLLQLIEKNSPAKAPSPKTMLRMRAAETSPPSTPVSVSSLQTCRRLHAGHPDLPALQAFLSSLPSPASGASRTRTRSQKLLFGTPQMGLQSPESSDKRPAGLRGGEPVAAERGGGAGAAGLARPVAPLPGCLVSGQRYFGPFFESSAAVVRLDCRVRRQHL